jgi:hypothetical protein
MLIGLKRIRIIYNEKNIVLIILLMLRYYEIISKFEVFIANNVNLNNIIIAEILKIAHSDLIVNEICDYCFNHIINLAAKTFLFKKKINAFKMIVDLINDLISFKSELIRKTQKV